jgi:hypothetical protein
MDKEIFTKKSTKTLGSRNILVTKEILSNDYYEPNVAAEAKPSPTGHLELLKIEPRQTQAKMPTFSVRWDHKDDTVDVDLLGNKEESYHFKTGANGYRGHKTKRLDRPSRVHSIDIETPSTGLVFKGTITLNIDLAESVDFGISPSIEFSAQVIRDGKIVDEGN